jgi:hypothetical protein
LAFDGGNEQQQWQRIDCGESMEAFGGGIGQQRQLHDSGGEVTVAKMAFDSGGGRWQQWALAFYDGNGGW